MADPSKRAPAPPPSRPSHIILLDDWGRHVAGRVLAADADMLGALDVEGVKYRAATAKECRLAGIDATE